MNTSGEKLLTLLQDDDVLIVQNPEWYQQLIDCLNDLINYDFARLVNLLYRLDVSEEKLKTLLSDHPTENAPELIARLILERQLQKILNRKEFAKPCPDIDEVEKW